MKRKYSVLTIASLFLFLLVGSLGWAETSSALRSKATIRGLSRLQKPDLVVVAQSSANPGQRVEQIEPIFITTEIAGVGRIRIELSKKWVKDWPAFFTTAHGAVHHDDSWVLLLRGTYTVLSQQRDEDEKTFPIAVTVMEGDNGSELTAHFHSRRRIREDVFAYSVKIDLSQPADDLWAVVHHVPLSILENYSCGLETSPQHLIHQASSLPITAAASGNRQVQLATEADYEYFSLHGSNTNSVIAGLVNTAQTIYDGTFDIDFSITAQNYQSSASQPYTSTVAATLLEEFRDYTNTNEHLGWADLFHLFTGKDVDGNTIGLAYKGVLCKSLVSRYSFTQEVLQSTDHFTFAHEVAHNFDASHYDSEPNIMNTVADPDGTSFADFTVNEVESFLASNWRCLGNTAEPVQQITMTGAVNPDPPGGTIFTVNLTSDQGWGTFGIVDFLGRLNSESPFQTLIDDLDMSTASTAAFTTQNAGQFKARLEGTNLETGIITVKEDGSIINPSPTPTPTPPPTATPTPNPNMTLTGKFKKPGRNRFICKVKLNDQPVQGQTVAMDQRKGRKGSFKQVKTKISNLKGLAKFPTKRIKKRRFLRCRVGGTTSKAKKFRGIRK